jgi:hypothetical protein
MAKIALGWDDKLDYTATVITSSSAAPGYPAVNVGSVQPSEVWRSGEGVNNAWVLADFGAARTVASVYVGNANLTPTATWRIRFSTSDATGAAGDLYDSGVVAMGINITERRMFKLITSASGRYLRIDFVDTALTQLEIGKISLWAGLWQPTYNFQVGARLLHKDFSLVRDGTDGQQRARRGSMRTGVLFTLPAFNETDLRSRVLPMVRYAATSSEIVVCLDPAHATDIGGQTYVGMLEETPEIELFMTKWSKITLRIWRRI